MGSSQLPGIVDGLTVIKDMAGWMGDLFGGLDYFLGGDFQEFIGGGFMA